MGRFIILERLASGGMGVVYRAKDEALEREVAVKVPHSTYTGDPERRHRFLREARAAAALAHPNVAMVYEVGEFGESAYIAMELVEGTTLRRRLDGRSLPPDVARGFALQIARGLAAAHAKGITHRDLKPENVMVTSSDVVKLLDFGLAKIESVPASDSALGRAETATQLTMEGQILGTSAYMSPEQALGMPLDARSDVFAFGIVLYEMLAGRRPFTGATLGELRAAVARDEPAPLSDRRSEVDEALDGVVWRCLAKEAGERFLDAGAIVRALEVGTPRSSARSAPESLRGTRRRRWRALAITLGATLATTLGAAAIFARRPHPPPRVTESTNTATPRPVAIGLFDHPPPVTKSVEAAAAYRRALTDWRDGVRRPQASLLRAVQLDPEFAAAHLRFSMAALPPASTREYGAALRFRTDLDARDQDLLRAEEPVAAGVPPDLEEGERRYAALHEAMPQDVEILLRLAEIRRMRDPTAASATFRELLELAPTMAGAELAAGDNAKEMEGVPSASAHYRRCVELSPMATRCLSRVAHIDAANGRCDVYAREMTRILELEPDDPFFQKDGLSAALATGASEDDIQAAIRGTVRARRHYEAFQKEELLGEVALWRGAMVDARDAFLRADRAFPDDAEKIPYSVTYPQRLAIAEELDDKDDVRALTRAYVGARALTTQHDFDEYALTALTRYRVLPLEEIRRLRDHWRNEVTDAPAEILWLHYDASLATTEEEARTALASGFDAKIRDDAPDVNAQLGHVLLLARRLPEAVARLELVASNCALFGGETSYIPWIASAAYDLGEAEEGLGDIGKACIAYRRMLDRWGNATPRSATAAGSRMRWRALGCAD